jgi:hypothetical protein
MSFETTGVGAPEAMFPARRRPRTRRRRYKASHLAIFLLGGFGLLSGLTWALIYLPRWR